MSLTVTLDRDDLLNLITSLEPSYGGDDFSEFCGNQWNEAWRWKRLSFSKISDEGLWEFYKQRKAEAV